ncbi:hypothetical protein ABZY06_28200 [Streptomyces sp. NPDC006540]|uniref:hypothetical protein n=1 Tax=Streptomyces sp. NPDC006540 TaxID=3155353 RepID=UPI0033B792E7
MDRPLLSQRATLVFLLALIGGVTAGVLTALAGEGTPRSVLAGLATAGLSVPFFNRLIAAETAGCREAAGAGTREAEDRG